MTQNLVFGAKEEGVLCCGLRPSFSIGWYPARYDSGLGSILAMDDITSHIDASLNDVVILEEPEHLNWYRAAAAFLS